MKIEDVVSNVKICGLDDSIKDAKSPVDSGYDNFLNGTIVQFDLTLTNKEWFEAQQYHWIDFVGSQSMVRRIVKFNLYYSCVYYVDSRIITVVKEKVKRYNRLVANRPEVTLPEYEDEIREAYLEILYNIPESLRLTARITASYQQLKTIYGQCKRRRPSEWRAFCSWIETLPSAEFIVGK